MIIEYKNGEITQPNKKEQNIYTIEELKNSSEEHSLHIVLTQEQSIDVVVNEVAKILSETKGSKIKVEDVVLELDKGYLYTEDELQHLKDLNTICEGVNLHLDIKIAGHNYTENLEKFIISRKKVEDFAEKVNNLKINGQNLSPAEKFMCCYAFAANRRYNDDKQFDNDSKRNWIGVLSGDEVICSGFASTLKMLCDRVFSKEELRCYEQSLNIHIKETGKSAGHANNIVFINDPKYDIFNFFYCDSCWDCLKDNITPTFSFCLLPIQQAKNIKRSSKNNIRLSFDREDFFYHQSEQYKASLQFDRECLLTDLDKMFGKKPNKEISEEITEQYKTVEEDLAKSSRQMSFSERIKKSTELRDKKSKEINEQIAQKHEEI